MPAEFKPVHTQPGTERPAYSIYQLSLAQSYVFLFFDAKMS